MSAAGGYADIIGVIYVTAACGDAGDPRIVIIGNYSCTVICGVMCIRVGNAIGVAESIVGYESIFLRENTDFYALTFKSELVEG